MAYFLVPTWSHRAKFVRLYCPNPLLHPYTYISQLTEPERARLLARLASDSDAANDEKFEWFFVWQAFTDHLVWGYALLFHGFAFALYSLSLFTVRFARLSLTDLFDVRLFSSQLS